MRSLPHTGRSRPPAPPTAVALSEDSGPISATYDPDLPADLEFSPVPRKRRSNGLTPQRQRLFIAMLAQCGSVRTAVKAVGCSSHAVYHLRNSPGADSFAMAWDRAVERGARRVLDVLVDHAINGTPEYIYKDGEIIGERRHFNTRSMMWIVAHYLPDRFGVGGGLLHAPTSPMALKRLKAQWHAEWAEEKATHMATDADTDAIILQQLHALNLRMRAEAEAETEAGAGATATATAAAAAKDGATDLDPKLGWDAVLDIGPDAGDDQ